MKNSTLKTHIGYWISRLQNQVSKAFERRLNSHKITVAEWCILIALYDEQANSVTSLAKYIEVSKPVVSRIITQLMKKELVEIRAGINRRSEIIILSAPAKLIVPQLSQEADINDQAFFGCLDSHEQENLRLILNKLLTSNSNFNIDGWLVQPINKFNL